MKIGFGRFFTFGFFLLFATQAWASDPGDLPTPESRSTWETDIGLDLYDFNYAEVVQPPLQSQETGFLWGLRGGVRYNPRWHRHEHLYFKLILEYSGSNTSYTGTTQIGNDESVTAITGTSSGLFGIGELQSGMDVKQWDDNNILSVFFGVGVRYWKRGVTQVSNSTGGGGYNEIYVWPTIEAGPRYFYRVNEKWSLSPEAALVWMPTGSLDVALSQLNSSLQDASVTLGGTVGFRLAGTVRYQINTLESVSVMPWFQYSTIGQSNTTEILQTNGSQASSNGLPLSLIEPNSRTYQFGVYISFALASEI